MKAVRTSLPAGLQDFQSFASARSGGGIPPADLEGAFTFYEGLPSGEVRVSQLEHLARLRLKVLQLVDRKSQRQSGGTLSTSGSNLDEFEQLEGGNILAGIPAVLKESPEDDILSHYICRMGFGRNTEFTDWLIRQEEILFFVKLKSAGAEGLKQTLERTGIANEVKSIVYPDSGLYEEIRREFPVGSSAPVAFYILPFTRITPSLVARRQVVLKRGLAYVPEQDMYGLVTARYKAYLSQCMRLAEREYKSFMEDERMARIVKSLSPTAFNSSSSKLSALTDSQTLNLANFNVCLTRSFPPCMRLPVEWMRERRSHLKNTARNQLYSFVRAAGMTMEESVTLWKKEFTADKAVPVDKFDKDYLYTIRWTYGKAGRMKAATAMSCSTVIGLEHPSHDQSHGCVFKVLDPASLANLLKKWAIVAGLADSGFGWIQDIVAKAGHSHEYQLACVEFFRNMHPGATADAVGNSPAAYFSESIDYWKKLDAPADGTGAAGKSGTAQPLSRNA